MILPEQFNTTHKDVDGTTDVVVTWDKKAHDESVALYRDYQTVLNSIIPEHSLRLKLVEPVSNNEYYGTQRNYLTLRKGYLATSPVGDRVQPGILKLESSLPAALSDEQKNQLYLEFLAVVQSQEFKDFLFKKAI